MIKEGTSASNSTINRKGLIPKYIAAVHKLRKKLLYGIQPGDRDLIAEYEMVTLNRIISK